MIFAMVVATLVLWATLATGVIVLAWWYEPSQISRRSKAVGWGHASIAVVAGVLWTTFLIARSDTVGIAALSALALAPIAGIATLLSTRHDGRRAQAEHDSNTVPTAVLVVHACAAAASIATVVTAFLSTT